MPNRVRAGHKWLVNCPRVRRRSAGARCCRPSRMIRLTMSAAACGWLCAAASARFRGSRNRSVPTRQSLPAHLTVPAAESRKGCQRATGCMGRRLPAPSHKRRPGAPMLADISSAAIGNTTETASLSATPVKRRSVLGLLRQRDQQGGKGPADHADVYHGLAAPLFAPTRKFRSEFRIRAATGTFRAVPRSPHRTERQHSI
jgi:hypothetical protein